MEAKQSEVESLVVVNESKLSQAPKNVDPATPLAPVESAREVSLIEAKRLNLIVAGIPE